MTPRSVPHPTLEERREAGELARKRMPRSNLEGWQPADNRPDPEAMSYSAGVCGWTPARAHARSGDPAVVAAYLGFERPVAPGRHRGVPRRTRKRLRHKAETQGWTAEEAASYVLRVWADD